MQLTQSSDSPQLDCQLILAHCLKKDRAWFYGHGDEKVSQQEMSEFRHLIQRRNKGEPVAYITGSKAFWTREFKVTRDTLIPRPETELIIDLVLSRFDHTERRVLDLGTGTGAIGVSLAAERPDWQVTCTDRNPASLTVARENATGLSNVRFVISNWYDRISSQFDIIACNPPYLRTDDPHLDALCYEPAEALIAGPDGLDAYRVVIAGAPDHLEPGGMLILEHGYDQQSALTEMMQSAGFCDTECFNDIQGLPRVILGRKGQAHE